MGWGDFLTPNGSSLAENNRRIRRRGTPWGERRRLFGRRAAKVRAGSTFLARYLVVGWVGGDASRGSVLEFPDRLGRGWVVVVVGGGCVRTAPIETGRTAGRSANRMPNVRKKGQVEIPTGIAIAGRGGCATSAQDGQIALKNTTHPPPIDNPDTASGAGGNSPLPYRNQV